MKNILLIIVLVLMVVLTIGLAVTLLVPEDSNFFKPNNNTNQGTTEVQYEPVFEVDFKKEVPMSALAYKDSMPVAPYAYKDTTLFAGKRITRIDVPVATVSAIDDNQYFTLYVIKQSVVKAGGIYTDEPYEAYKIYLPEKELTSTSVEKWITVDLSDQFIYVGEDETLAFMNENDPVVCRYSGNTGYPFVFKLNLGGQVKDAQSLVYGIYTEDIPNLKGKTFSILGDSISTFNGISNDAVSSNDTIGENAVFYPKFDIDNSTETWWAQAAEATGMELMVNNSWSGSCVLNSAGSAHDDRCIELHDNTSGNVKHINPDIIAVYMGVNDFNQKNPVGAFNELSDIYTKESGYIEPKTFADAYAMAVHRMITKYEDSDIFLFTLPVNSRNADNKTLEKYNDVIKDIADYFKCYVVDLADVDGYDIHKYTTDGLHPNEIGMDLISQCFVRTLKGVYGIGKLPLEVEE